MSASCVSLTNLFIHMWKIIKTELDLEKLNVFYVNGTWNIMCKKRVKPLRIITVTETVGRVVWYHLSLLHSVPDKAIEHRRGGFDPHHQPKQKWLYWEGTSSSDTEKLFSCVDGCEWLHSLIPGGETNPFRVASGRPSGVKTLPNQECEAPCCGDLLWIREQLKSSFLCWWL